MIFVVGSKKCYERAMLFCPIVGVAAPGEIAVASLEQPRVMRLLQVSTRHKWHRARRRHPALNPITINPRFRQA